MIKVITATLLLLATQSVLAGDFYIDWQVAYSPPGGDIIAGSKIGRYVIEAEPTVRYGFATLSVNAKAYGVRPWVTKEIRGHGMDKFKGSYGWSAKSWRYALTPRLELGNEEAHFFIENYSPVDRHGVWNEGRSHGQETEYYWLIGVSGRMTF